MRPRLWRLPDGLPFLDLAEVSAGGGTIAHRWRETLPIGATVDGPAVVQQYDTTTLLHPG